MLGLILWYFIGKYFYDLAKLYKKSKWGFAILGIFSYYLGPIILGLSLGLYGGINSELNIENIDSLSLDLLAIPTGLFSCWITYMLLKRHFEKKSSTISNDMLDYEILSDPERD